MKLLFAATPATGHVNPILYAAEALIQAGHDVLITTGSVFADDVRAIGARFHPLAPAADIDARNHNQLFPERKKLPPPAQVRFDAEHLFIGKIAPQFETLRGLIKSFAPDVVLYDVLFLGALPFLLGATRSRPRFVAIGMTALPVRRDDLLPFGPGLPLVTEPKEIAQYGDLLASIEENFNVPTLQLLNQTLERLGAQSISGSWLESLAVLPDLYLQAGVPGFEYPRRELPRSVHFIGALGPHRIQPLPNRLEAELSAAEEAGKRIVLVTQGTVANENLGALLAPTLEALAHREDLLVLASTGGRAISAVPCVLPDNAIVTPYLPFAGILPRLSAFITNGGYGAITQALQHGVPVVVAGDTEEKPEVAARVEWSGVGINLRTTTPSIAALNQALHNILECDKYLIAARELSREFQKYDAPRELDRLLTYAASTANV